MPDYRLKAGDPLSLVLAADARLAAPSYTNDQIWELDLGGGEPRSLALTTTYGLRARRMQMFPRFKEKGESVHNPDDFFQPPVLNRFFPNYLRLKFTPFPGIDVTNELWVPESQAIAGRLWLRNSGVTPRAIYTDWVAILSPNEGGRRMEPARIQGVTVLRGQTEGLCPVVFLTGGIKAQHSPYPALGLNIELMPGEEHVFTWAQAAQDDHSRSFEVARKLVGLNWEGEFARLELTNAAQIEVSTGEPDWDAAFALGQTAAFSLIHGPTEHLPHKSFLLSRVQDQGYSRRGDGSDYDHLWNGQTCLDAWYLASNLLPGAAELVKGFIRNFLHVQSLDGYVDWKPGLGGQRSRVDATPTLAALTWQLYEHTEDREFLAEVFPDLLTFALGWFSPYHDRDGDGVPEWDHPMQAGLSDHPQFAPWLAWSQGVDIRSVESPALSAFLYNECRLLIKMAMILDHSDPVPPLEAIQEKLAMAVEQMWEPKTGGYLYRDRDTHANQEGKAVVELQGQPQPIVRRRLRRKYDPPARLLAAFHLNSLTDRETTLQIRGVDHQGARVEEKIEPDMRHIGQGRSVITSQQAYRSLSGLVVEDLRPGETVSLQTVDHRGRDLSQFLPMWAGLTSKEQTEAMIEMLGQDTGGYRQNYGFSLCPDLESLDSESLAACAEVLLPWNTLITQGLLACGQRVLAAALVSNMMEAVILNLKSQGKFRGRYHAVSGTGAGERHALTGLPPLALFLQTLGLRVISPWKVRVEGTNPFPWPVEVRYKELVVRREQASTEVVFPDGHAVTITETEPCFVER